MRRFISAVCFVTAALVGALPLTAQPKRTSPHETISKVIAGNRVTLVYGRPYSRDPESGAIRKIWGALVPYGKIWRTGSDEATLFITQQPIDLGGTAIPAGAYTLFTWFDADGRAQLVVNKQLGQWGLQYDAKQDLARIALKKAPLDPALDQFTLALDKDEAGTGGTLRLMWETTQFTVPLTVKK